MTALAFYQHRESAVHSLNPMTKLVLSIASIIAAFAISVPWWPAALFVVILLPAVLVSHTQGKFASLLLKFFVPLLIVIFLIQGLFFPGDGAVLAQLGPLTVKSTGLVFAARTSLRLLVLIGAFLFLLLTTHPGTLMGAMTQHGMAPNISYVVSATLQIIPTFRARAQNILQAQRARGLETRGSVRRRVRALLPLVGPLILGSLTDVEERSVAMEARAFGSPAKRTSLVVIPDTSAQRVARWGLWAFAAATLAVNALGVVR